LLHSSPLQPMLCPMGIHKNPETSPRPATPERDSDDCLHRRHTPYSRVQGASSGPVSSSSIPTRVSGIHHQHREVCAHRPYSSWVLQSTTLIWRYWQDKTDSSRVSTANEDGGASLSSDTSTPTTQINSTKCVISPAPLFHRNQQMALSDALETSS